MIMERYTIYCGLAVGGDHHSSIVDNSRSLAFHLADTHLEEYTAKEGIGRWNGERERTLVFTYLAANRVDITKVNAFAHAYKYQNNQDAVLIVEEEVKVRFYGAE